MSLVELPFDQYQRYRAVADLLAAAPAGVPETVLEVGGGGESQVAAFLPRTRVVIADLEFRGAREAGVASVRADGCRPLPFRDGAFAAAVTVDTLEHLPPEARAPLVRELRRVSRGPIVVACPVSSPEADAAERALAVFFQVVFGREHRWLAEHLAHGLPRAEEIDQVCARLGGAWKRLPNGYLPEWQALMLVHLLFEEVPGGPASVAEIRALDAFYNARLFPFSNRAPAYRMLWVHAPRPADLPAAETLPTGEPSPTERAEFERLLRSAERAAPTARAHLIDAEVRRLGTLLAETTADRERVEEDRRSVDVERLEALAECERVRADRDRVDAARAGALAALAQLEQAHNALATNWARVDAERRRLEQVHHSASLEIGELRWRLGRLAPLDRALDVVSPYLRPVLAPLRARHRRAAPEPGATDGARPAPSVTFVLIDPRGDDPEAVARTRGTLDAQDVPPAGVCEAGPSPDWATLGGAARGSHVALLVAGDELDTSAVAEVTRVLQERPDATVVYSDEDECAPDGRRQHAELKPDWDPDLARAANYVGALACFRRDLLARVPVGSTSAEAGYALTLAAAEENEALARHLPLLLCHTSPGTRAVRRLDLSAPAARALLAAHLARSGDAGEVVVATPGLAVRRPVEPTVRASIIIPFRDQPKLLEACVASIRAHTVGPRWELVLVDNCSSEPRTAKLLDRLTAADPESVRVLRYTGPFNFSAINNFAAREAKGDVLVLLNNDTEILTPDWLATLVGLANRPRAGAVGALMLFPDGRVQHCGIALGMGSWPGRIHGVAGLMFSGCRLEDVPPLLHAFDRRSGAVTAACLAVRRDRYLAVGGMDETLHTDFNDVDLCLKLAARGFPNLFTPHVSVLHHESASRTGRPIDPREVDLMYDRWGDRLAYDPFVSPHIDPAGPHRGRADETHARAAAP